MCPLKIVALISFPIFKKSIPSLSFISLRFFVDWQFLNQSCSIHLCLQVGDILDDIPFGNFHFLSEKKFVQSIKLLGWFLGKEELSANDQIKSAVLSWRCLTLAFLHVFCCLRDEFEWSFRCYVCKLVTYFLQFGFPWLFWNNCKSLVPNRFLRIVTNLANKGCTRTCPTSIGNQSIF